MHGPDGMYAGRCTCGQVRYRMESAPLIVHCCHCRWCQRETGAAFALNAMIETERLKLLAGEPVRVTVPSESGKGQAILRCPVCEIAVWSHYLGAGEQFAFVRIGTLEEPDRLPPGVHIYIASKQPWVVLPDGVPSFPEFYRRSTVWPAANLERREAVLGGA